MITNNKYIRGNIGEFDKQVSSNIKIEDYEGNKANKYLITKEYLNFNFYNLFNSKIIYFDKIIYDLNYELILNQRIDNNNDIYIIYQKSFIEINDYDEEIIIVKNYLVKLIFKNQENTNYIYILDKQNLNDLYSGQIYMDYNNKLFLCLNDIYIIPLIQISDEIFEFNNLEKTIDSVNIKYNINFIINYFSYIKIKYIDLNVYYKINSILNLSLKIQKNINTEKTYSFNLNDTNELNYVNINFNQLFIKLIYTFNYDFYDYMSPPSLYYYFIKYDTIIDYDIYFYKDYNILHSLNAFSTNFFDEYYNNFKSFTNIISTTNNPILFTSNTSTSIIDISSFEDFSFIFNGENINLITNSSSSTITLTLKKQSSNFFLNNTLPTPKSTYYNDNGFSYYDFSNFNYRYVLMEDNGNNNFTLGIFNKTSIDYIENNNILLYHYPSKTFLISTTCSTNNNIETVCFLPIQNITSDIIKKNILNDFFNKNLTLFNKCIFSDNLHIELCPQSYSNSSYIYSDYWEDNSFNNLNVLFDLHLYRISENEYNDQSGNGGPT